MSAKPFQTAFHTLTAGVVLIFILWISHLTQESGRVPQSPSLQVNASNAPPRPYEEWEPEPPAPAAGNVELTGVQPVPEPVPVDPFDGLTVSPEELSAIELPAADVAATPDLPPLPEAPVLTGIEVSPVSDATPKAGGVMMDEKVEAEIPTLEFPAPQSIEFPPLELSPTETPAEQPDGPVPTLEFEDAPGVQGPPPNAAELPELQLETTKTETESESESESDPDSIVPELQAVPVPVVEISRTSEIEQEIRQLKEEFGRLHDTLAARTDETEQVRQENARLREELADSRRLAESLKATAAEEDRQSERIDQLQGEMLGEIERLRAELKTMLEQSAARPIELQSVTGQPQGGMKSAALREPQPVPPLVEPIRKSAVAMELERLYGGHEDAPLPPGAGAGTSARSNSVGGAQPLPKSGDDPFELPPVPPSESARPVQEPAALPETPSHFPAPLTAGAGRCGACATCRAAAQRATVHRPACGTAEPGCGACGDSCGATCTSCEESGRGCLLQRLFGHEEECVRQEYLLGMPAGARLLPPAVPRR